MPISGNIYRKGTALRKSSIKAFTFITLPLCATLAGCGGGDLSPVLAVTDAVIVANPVEGRPSAAYFTIHGGPQPVQLISVNVNSALRTEMHSTTTEKGVMSMKTMTVVDVPAGGMVQFKQGGNHAMVFGLPKYAVDQGYSKIFFGFSNGKKIEVKATVAKAGSAEHAGHTQ